MTLADSLKHLQKNAERLRSRLETEEATKMALVVPFLRVLGFDPFDPDVVIPEFTADVGVKKGEKVDYALKQNDQVIMLVECKSCGANLSEAHFGQLFRYFSVTAARVGILTNGLEYWFFSDVDERNKLDSRPFYRFSMDSFNESDLRQIEKFSAKAFDCDSLEQTASILKYTHLLKTEVKKEITEPTEDIIKLFTKRVYNRHFTISVKETFEPLVAAAFTETIRDIVNTRLTHALSQVNEEAENTAPQEITEESAAEGPNGIITTQDELEAFLIVKNIARRYVNKERISMRDQKSYCNVLLDNTNRKPIVRFHFDSAQKRLSFGREIGDRVSIDSVDDIFDFEERIREVLQAYETD